MLQTCTLPVHAACARCPCTLPVHAACDTQHGLHTLETGVSSILFLTVHSFRKNGNEKKTSRKEEQNGTFCSLAFIAGRHSRD